MEVILDSSFIISCIKKKIDFLSQLKEQGFEIKVPREVMQEMKDLRLRTKRAEREAIDLALIMIEQENVKKMTLGNREVDKGLIIKGKEGYYIATLDREIKNHVQKKVVIFDAQKRVGVE